MEAAEGRLLCVGSEHWAYLIVETQDMRLVGRQDIRLVETQELGYVLCSEPMQRRRPSAASTKGGRLRPLPFVVSFVMALNKAHVLAHNTTHVLRLNKADVLRTSNPSVCR